MEIIEEKLKEAEKTSFVEDISKGKLAPKRFG